MSTVTLSDMIFVVHSALGSADSAAKVQPAVLCAVRCALLATEKDHCGTVQAIEMSGVRPISQLNLSSAPCCFIACAVL